jgi:1,4-dihydroxy-2-naphthoyl-CoA hydrolase
MEKRMTEPNGAAIDETAEHQPVDAAATDAMHQMIPFAKTLGIEVVAGSPTEVRGHLQWSAELCTSAGGLHGGAIMSIADNLGGVCAYLNLPEGAVGTTTIESKFNFLRAVKSGYVESVSRPLHVGRSVIVIVTDVTDAEGRLVARATQSQIILRP